MGASTHTLHETLPKVKRNAALGGPAANAFRRWATAWAFEPAVGTRPTEGNDSGSRVRSTALSPDYQDSGVNSPIFSFGVSRFQP